MNKLNLIALLSLVTLAGCETIDQPKPIPVATPQVSAEGDWVDTSGIVSSFHSGTFTTRTTDSNQVLASGTYMSTSPTLVEINMTSHVRKTQSKVNCQLVTANQLNCTSQTGAQFSLARRAASDPPLAPLPGEINNTAAATTTPAATTTSAGTTTSPATTTSKSKLPVLQPGASAKM